MFIAIEENAESFHIYAQKIDEFKEHRNFIKNYLAIKYDKLFFSDFRGK